ncbi:MAG: hypothetical protein AAF413_03195 [Patescibacteria group bacterium]
MSNSNPHVGQKIEQVLIGSDIFRNRSQSRQKMLACLACHLARDVQPHGAEIANCSDLHSQVVYSHLAALEDGLVLVPKVGKRTGKGGARKVVYSLSERRVAIKLAALIDTEEVGCQS